MVLPSYPLNQLAGLQPAAGEKHGDVSFVRADLAFRKQLVQQGNRTRGSRLDIESAPSHLVMRRGNVFLGYRVKATACFSNCMKQ